ncbi:MAG: DegT/DnrJ/EryC1/StrS family aminotransferase [Planctomycetota bacterium]|nr:DegT/DnrJ/EryC1/StrS family aminotransferase [Planctomycetota bacterium]
MTIATDVAAALAIHGGPKAIERPPEDLFRWPIVMPEDEAAVLDVLRRGAMSGTDVTQAFEKEFAAWFGVEHALAHPNGTAALHAALFAVGVGQGDEVICPSITYWASATQALNLGASLQFCDVDPVTLNIDPADFERRITPRTKAVVVVHYTGYPCEMDRILAIARPRGIKVIEDVSHAHGARYHGKLVGTLGDVAGMSLMSGKSLAAGEAGMLITHDRAIFERAVAWGHYERMSAGTKYFSGEPFITDPALLRFAGIPLGGFKNRLNQMSAALGRGQLRHYAGRMAEIDRAMNAFWDAWEALGLPGITAHRPPRDSGLTMGGWYNPLARYDAAAFHGTTVEAFCAALNAEGFRCTPGANKPMHAHPLFHEADVYHAGKPTNLAHANRDLRMPAGSLPSAEAANARVFGIPWFKHHRPEEIGAYVAALAKVARAALEGRLSA